MPDYLGTIRRIIEEHKSIRMHVRLAGDAISDRESLSAVSEVGSAWVPGRLDKLTEKYQKLQQTMSLLDDGLNNHFRHEEEELPPLLGEHLMRALLLEHNEVRKQIAEARRVLAETTITDLSREQILATELKIQQLINNTSHVIEDHALREEVVLSMLEQAFGKP